MLNLAHKHNHLALEEKEELVIVGDFVVGEESRGNHLMGNLKAPAGKCS